MKIEDIKMHILEGETPGYVTSFSEVPEVPGPRPTFKYSLLRILTDEGIEGDYIAWPEIPTSRPDSLREVLRAYKPYLIGEDPLDRERVWQTLGSFWYGYRGPALAAVDIALWDIAGKVTGLPVYKLLGAYRDKIRAYASGGGSNDTEEIIKKAAKLRTNRYTAMKLHYIPVEACIPLREEVGDQVDLIYDAVFRFNYEEALKVGRMIEELDFFWYEAPLPAYDIEGYAELCRKLDIPVNVELLDSTRALEYIQKKAIDSLRTLSAFTGGITEMIKLANLCEGFGINWEPHCFGGIHYQAANLHVALAVKHCTFFEVPIDRNGEEGPYNLGTQDSIGIDREGFVHGPREPGLGFEVDWKQVENGIEVPL